RCTIHEITRNKLNLTSSSCLLRVSSWIVLVFRSLLARIIHEGASRGQERGVRVAVCERDRRATSLRDFWCWILVRAQCYTELRWIEEKSWPWSGGGRRL